MSKQCKSITMSNVRYIEAERTCLGKRGCARRNGNSAGPDVWDVVDEIVRCVSNSLVHAQPACFSRDVERGAHHIHDADVVDAQAKDVFP